MNVKMLKMIKLMTGAIFADGYISDMAKLNKKSFDVQVNEVYGSMRHTSGLRTARPDHRLVPISHDELADYVNECHQNNIEFNYTANAPIIGSLEEISKEHDKMVAMLDFLQRIKVDRITLAHPAMMQLVCDYTTIPIEISTIMEIRHPAQLLRLKQLYPNVDKVCIALEINRNINQVGKLKKFCDIHGIKLEVLASEFCKTGRSNCVHRKQCYDMHSFNMSHEAARKGINSDGSVQPLNLKGYPWNGKAGCIYSRAEDISWLIGNTIWPQHIEQYSIVTGVEHFKITTRTAPPEYGKWLTEAYITGRFEGYLASLWLQLQASSAYAMRQDFKKMQERSMPKFEIDDLLRDRRVTTKVGGKEYTGTDFMSIYFDNPDVDWSQIVWVDKPDDKLEDYECNWGDKWVKLLSNETK